jgi:hypothetical protein
MERWGGLECRGRGGCQGAIGAGGSCWGGTSDTSGTSVLWPLTPRPRLPPAPRPPATQRVVRQPSLAGLLAALAAARDRAARDAQQTAPPPSLSSSAARAAAPGPPWQPSPATRAGLGASQPGWAARLAALNPWERRQLRGFLLQVGASWAGGRAASRPQGPMGLCRGWVPVAGRERRRPGLALPRCVPQARWFTEGAPPLEAAQLELLRSLPVFEVLPPPVAAAAAPEPPGSAPAAGTAAPAPPGGSPPPEAAAVTVAAAGDGGAGLFVALDLSRHRLAPPGTDPRLLGPTFLAAVRKLLIS